jgi:Zn-dependent protease/CBS domain-containing protein
MVGQTFRIGRIFGIDVGIHASWLLIFALVTWSLAVGYFPSVLPDIGRTEALVLGIVAAILLFGSVLVHELAHSLVARARGLDARSITLFLFGGVSNLGGESKQPATEFLVAVVGPLTSLVLAGLAFGASLAFGAETQPGVVAAYLAMINLLLGLFNLLPGFPLDGGRVLRAIVWNATGSLRRATEVAVRVGQLVAYGFLAWGFWRVLDGELLGGIWIAAIGWFLHGAASASLQQVIVDQRLRGVRVGDVVRPDPTFVLPGESVARLVDEIMLPGYRRAVPVVDGRVVGIVTLSDVRAVPPERRASTTVAEIMGGRNGVRTIGPEASLLEALEALGAGDFEQLPVVDGGRLVGLLTRGDVVRAIQIREELGIGG